MSGEGLFDGGHMHVSVGLSPVHVGEHGLCSLNPLRQVNGTTECSQMQWKKYLVAFSKAWKIRFWGIVAMHCIYTAKGSSVLAYCCMSCDNWPFFLLPLYKKTWKVKKGGVSYAELRNVERQISKGNKTYKFLDTSRVVMTMWNLWIQYIFFLWINLKSKPSTVKSIKIWISFEIKAVKMWWLYSLAAGVVWTASPNLRGSCCMGHFRSTNCHVWGGRWTGVQVAKRWGSCCSTHQ